MGQFFTDDIDSLLKAGHGDAERLTRIKSDFETKKLVTIDDRKYVEGLVSRYLQESKPESERIAKMPEKRIVPPPSPQPSQTPSFEMKYQKPREEPIPKIGGKNKMRNVVASIAAVVAALLIISVVAMNQDNLTGIQQPPASKNLEVDQASYVRGDIISISGIATVGTVNLVISNPANEQIWTETVSTKQSGEFSTLVIAGGDGWEQAGRYTLFLMSGGTIVNQVTFDFNPNET
jgi:hypothetical protein